MSADLFAQFGSFSGSNTPANQQQGQSQPQATAPTQQPDDPFAFLSTAFSQPPQQPQIQAPQSHTPQPKQWSFGASTQSQQPAVGWGGGSAGGWGKSMAGMASHPTTQEAGDDEDDDTWGDFEEASGGDQAQLPSIAAPPAYQASYANPSRPRPSEPTRTRVIRASTMDLISNTLINFGDTTSTAGALPPGGEPSSRPPQRDPWRNPEPEPTPKPRKPADPNVLFDAEDFEVNGASDDDDFDEDDFGDFESGHTSPPRPTAATTNLFTPQPPISQPATAKPIPTPAAATALIDLLSLSDPEPSATTPAFPMQPQPQAAPSVNRQAASLLSPLSFGSTAPATSQTPKSPSFQDRNPFPGLAVTTPLSGEFPIDKVRNRTPSPVTTWPSFEAPSTTSTAATKKAVPQPDEADWDAWGVEESEPSQPVSVQAKKAPAQTRTQPKTQPQPKKVSKVAKPEPAASDWDWEAEEPSQGADKRAPTALPPAIANAPIPNAIPDKAPPPTNVPPPSVLLSLFPTLIAMPDEVLFKPTAAQPAEVRNRVIGNPKTIAFLRNYLQIIVVAGRVIAGRKQRWHRDKFLSQSMSISAAGSGKGGGMKLAGLDKAQGQREDREAADVVAAWIRHVGKLRTAVATANAALVAAEAAEHKHYQPLKVPELQSATIPVTVAKQVQTAIKPCIICGLRRDERVRGIDGDDVEDIFSEWWVEHWGHRVCRNFWAEHEAALRSR